MVRLVNQYFLKIWQLHDPEVRKNLGLISLICCHQWNLSEEQYANLMHYLAANPVLQQLDMAKQSLARLMLLKTVTARRARKKLPQLTQLLSQLRDSPLRA